MKILSKIPYKKLTYAPFMLGCDDFAYHVKRDLFNKFGGNNSRGSNNTINVVCYTTNTNQNFNNYIFYGKGNTKQAFENKIKTNKLKLIEFMKFVKTNFKSKYYLLNLYGHGYSWMTMCFSKKYNIEIDELKYALTKYKFDIIVFETCAGMSIETVYELRKKTNYICGNCDYTGTYGIEHKKVLKKFVNNNVLCKSVVDNMNKDYCPSFIKTNKILFVKQQINRISKILLLDIQFIINLKDNLTSKIVDDLIIDIGYFLYYIIKNSKNKKLKKICKKLYIYLSKNVYCKQKNKFIKYKCLGLNIFFPRKNTYYLDHIKQYKTLEFNKNNKWIDVIMI